MSDLTKHMIFGAFRPKLWRGQNQALWQIVAAAKETLGEQGYQVDYYVSKLLRTIHAIDPHNAASDGEYQATQLRKLCWAALQNESSDHDYFETVKVFVEKHPLPYQEEHTQVNLYVASLFPEWFSRCVTEFHEESSCDYRSDLTDLPIMSRELEKKLGNPKQMKALNTTTLYTHLQTTGLDCFVQGMLQDYGETLMTKDIETGKYIFQLWLDRPELHSFE